ncbi:hypothetical protein EI94DRAFT_1072237 [Lactarius quietus]|nr:hypothetical protein EI94DRAFT_1072237 [Lactarius quietus]
MLFSTFTLLSCAITVVNAHFQVAYPPPRGVFVEDNEPTFCDGYVQAVSNRSEYPLGGGFITLNSEHPSWNLAILISTVQDPTSFDNFTNSTGGQQFVRNFASGSGEGGFCIPLDLNNTGISGIQDGANVTLQYVYNGGDGSLYECSDLTLSNNFTIPSNVSCSNATSTSSSSTPSSTSTSSKGNSASKVVTTGFLGMLGFIVAMVSVL